MTTDVTMQKSQVKPYASLLDKESFQRRYSSRARTPIELSKERINEVALKLISEYLLDKVRSCMSQTILSGSEERSFYFPLASQLRSLLPFSSETTVAEMKLNDKSIAEFSDRGSLYSRVAYLYRERLLGLTSTLISKQQERGRVDENLLAFSSCIANIGEVIDHGMTSSLKNKEFFQAAREQVEREVAQHNQRAESLNAEVQEYEAYLKEEGRRERAIRASSYENIMSFHSTKISPEELEAAGKKAGVKYQEGHCYAIEGRPLFWLDESKKLLVTDQTPKGYHYTGDILRFTAKRTFYSGGEVWLFENTRTREIVNIKGKKVWIS
ncbi:MAG: hypothetical protein L7U87_03800 [Chlamydiales bacterium]|nr:hypothetical protein [Chlamydiales bacterium]